MVLGTVDLESERVVRRREVFAETSYRQRRSQDRRQGKPWDEEGDAKPERTYRQEDQFIGSYFMPSPSASAAG